MQIVCSASFCDNRISSEEYGPTVCAVGTPRDTVDYNHKRQPAALFIYILWNGGNAFLRFLQKLKNRFPELPDR